MAPGGGGGRFRGHGVQARRPRRLDLLSDQAGREATLTDFATTPGDGIDRFAREVVVAPATSFTHTPAGWSHAAAATLTTAGVTATSSSDEKLERLHAMGAAHGINYRRDEDWGDRVRELTGGTGVDHVVEVGGPGTLAQSIKATRLGGNIFLIGVLTETEGAVPTTMVMARQQRLQGLIVGSRLHQMDLIRGIDAVHGHPVIDRTFPLAAIPDAFRLQDSGGHFGKIVLEF